MEATVLNASEGSEFVEDKACPEKLSVIPALCTQGWMCVHCEMPSSADDIIYLEQQIEIWGILTSSKICHFKDIVFFIGAFLKNLCYQYLYMSKQWSNTDSEKTLKMRTMISPLKRQGRPPSTMSQLLIALILLI